MLSQEELKGIEAKFKVELPKFYKDFHLQDQELIVEAYLADDIWFSTNKKWLINHNRVFLQLPRADGLIRNKICIGTDGCGNDAFINLDENDKRIFILDHEIASDFLDEELMDYKWDEMETYIV